MFSILCHNSNSVWCILTRSLRNKTLSISSLHFGSFALHIFIKSKHFSMRFSIIIVIVVCWTNSIYFAVEIHTIEQRTPNKATKKTNVKDLTRMRFICVPTLPFVIVGAFTLCIYSILHLENCICSEKQLYQFSGSMFLRCLLPLARCVVCVIGFAANGNVWMCHILCSRPW